MRLEAPRLVPTEDLTRVASEFEAKIISPSRIVGAISASPRASASRKLEDWLAASGPVDLARWEPSYGRLAEAQVKWEAAHGRPLASA